MASDHLWMRVETELKRIHAMCRSWPREGPTLLAQLCVRGRTQ
jgi:hypothetical protein